MENKTILKRKKYFDVITNIKGEYLLFIIWPFLGFLFALRSYFRKDSRKIVLLFLILYGLTFVVIEGMDSSRYALQLKTVAAKPLTEFGNIIAGLYTIDASPDILQPIITFIVSRFTNDYHLLYGIFALVFGYVYLKSINVLYKQYTIMHNSNALVHLFFFALIIPIFNINGFRFYTAAWVYFYGAYHVIVNGERKYLWVSIIASLIHFSFLSAGAVLLIYYFVGNRNTIYYPLLIVSFILPDLMINYIPQISNLLGGGLQSRINLYNNEAYRLTVANAATERAWFFLWSDKAMLFYLYFAIIGVKIKFKEIGDLFPMKRLYSFLLLFLSFVNFGRNIPSVGRFQAVFFLFGVLYIFLVFSKKKSRKLNFITIIGLLPMLLYSLIVFRFGSDTMNAWLFAPGPLSLIATPISVYEIISKIFK